jgi:aromatic ring-opening dioxygenase catalytic subunit (LigB family)
MRLPTYFIPHGGGPCFFMDWNPPDAWDSLRAWLENIVPGLPEKPKAIVVVTAHWEADPVRVTAMSDPALVFDYHGFPPHTYQLTWPAPGAPDVAARVRALLAEAGIPSEDEPARGFDHGVFVPLKVMVPDADIPTVAVSLRPDLDPAFHQAMGAALSPLRDEGVLLLGSGMTYHNMRGFFSGGQLDTSRRFDDWLRETVGLRGAARAQALNDWAAAPVARNVHPREEHLIPMMVVAGAAGDDAGAATFGDVVMGVQLTGVRFG